MPFVSVSAVFLKKKNEREREKNEVWASFVKSDTFVALKLPQLFPVNGESGRNSV